MNITPVNVSYYQNKSINFKGRENKPASGPEPKPEPAANEVSKQNNSPEILIPTEAYLAMMAGNIFDKVSGEIDNPESKLFKSSDKVADITREALFDEEDDYDDEELTEAMAENSADILIFTLSNTAEQMGKVPSELKGKIPVFITSDANDYIKTMERNIEEGLNADYSQIQLPDLDDINSDPKMDKYSQEDKEQAAKFLEFAQNMLDDGTVEAILESQKALVEVLKTTRFNELNSALTDLNESMNYKLFRVINAGFERDPRAVVNLLSNDLTMYQKPDVEDNNDGTSTYLYPSITSCVEIVRNNKNGDFISAKSIKDGKEAFFVAFREDGFIDKLQYTNFTDESKILIKTKPDNNEIAVVQYYPNLGQDLAVARKFKRQEDGTLKLVSVQTFTK